MLDDRYRQAAELLPQLLAEVRRRKRAADLAGRAADQAIRENAAVQGRLTEAVHTLRELVAAMTDGAGYDGRHPLSEAVQAAEQVLRPEPEPGAPAGQ